MLQQELTGLVQRTNRDWALFGQKIVVSALAFIIVFILVHNNMISYSTAQEIKAIFDNAVMVWIAYSLLTLFIPAEKVLFVGIIWNLIQYFVLVTFPVLALFVNITNWDLNLTIATPALVIVFSVLALLDALISLVWDIIKGKTNNLFFVLYAIQIVQAIILLNFGLYIQQDFYLGDYYKELLHYIAYKVL